MLRCEDKSKWLSTDPNGTATISSHEGSSIFACLGSNVIQIFKILLDEASSFLATLVVDD